MSQASRNDRIWSALGRRRVKRQCCNTASTGNSCRRSLVSLLEHLLQTGEGAVRAPEVVAFLKALRRHLGDRKLLIVWDRLQAHRSRLVREYVESQEGAIHLEFLPPYAPELNPVEYLWAHWKHHEMANFCPKDFAELTVHARAKLRRTQRRKTLIAAFWKQAELPI